jgi:hypothetical protein
MSSTATDDKKKKSFKEKFKEEFIEYWINVLYLTIYFGVFATYKRLVLAQYDINFEEYGMAFINAFILGKVVSVGGMMKIGSKTENGSLWISTLFKTVFFTLWLALFNVVEELIVGYFKTSTFQGAIDALKHHLGTYEYFGGLLIVFTCFIPFFAIKELSRVVGHDKVINLFFRRKSSTL